MIHLAGPYRFDKLGNQKPSGEILGYKLETEEPQGQGKLAQQIPYVNINGFLYFHKLAYK